MIPYIDPLVKIPAKWKQVTLEAPGWKQRYSRWHACSVLHMTTLLSTDRTAYRLHLHPQGSAGSSRQIASLEAKRIFQAICIDKMLFQCRPCNSKTKVTHITIQILSLSYYKIQELASFLLCLKDCVTAFNPRPSNSRRITCQCQAVRNMGKLKPALGCFHIKHRNIILKPTANSNSTQAGINTESCKFNLNLCHALKGNTAAFDFWTLEVFLWQW